MFVWGSNGTESRRPRPSFGGDGDFPAAENRALGLEIGAETPVPDDYQPRPDYGLAVGLLLDRMGGAPLP